MSLTGEEDLINHHQPRYSVQHRGFLRQFGPVFLGLIAIGVGYSFCNKIEENKKIIARSQLELLVLKKADTDESGFLEDDDVEQLKETVDPQSEYIGPVRCWLTFYFDDVPSSVFERYIKN